MDNFFKKMFNKKKEDIKPGSFSDGSTGENQDNFLLKKELYEIDLEKEDKILPTKDLKKAFYEMKAETMPSVAALSEKREIISFMREEEYLDQNILRERKTIYVGSGTDIEYPVLLGARKIIMVDSDLGENSVKDIENKIIKITGKFEKTEKSFSFEIDFGAGKELVSLEIYHGWYGPLMPGMSEDNIKRFKFPENVGLVIGFASGGPLDRDNNLIPSIPKDSYIFDAYHLNDLDKQFNDYNQSEFIPINTRTEKEISEAYNKLGFEYFKTPKNILLRKIN